MDIKVIRKILLIRKKKAFLSVIIIKAQKLQLNSGAKSFQEKIYFLYGIFRLILMYTFKARTIKLIIFKD